MESKDISAHGISAFPVGRQIGPATALQRPTADEVRVEYYANQVPPFVEEELTRLYGHIFSSLLHFRAYGGISADISTYVARHGNTLSAVFLFVRKNNQVRVINEGMHLDAEEISRFCAWMFAADSSVHLITFHAIETALRRLPFPYQQFNCSEDIVLALPDSRAAYLASLGRATRSYLHRYESKLRKNYPSFALQIHERDDISAETIGEIVRMNRIRMAAKDKVSSNDDDEMERIVALAKACGMLAVATIDGRICAGVICYRVGTHYFMPVIAHDPAYNDCRLGTIGCYLTICECIARGGREFHFLWGRYDYKYRLGGVQRDLDHLAIYRSRPHMLLHANTALKTTAVGCSRSVRLWLESRIKTKGRASAVARAVLGLAGGLRALRRLVRER